MYYSKEPITLDLATRIAPSILASDQHESRSDQYAYVPTLKVLEALQGEGFNIHGVTQANTRDDSREQFTKHLIRMRRPQDNTDTEAPEIVLINSHDGSSSFRLMPGIIRFACANGLICGDAWDDIRIRHTGDIVGDVIEGTFTVIDDFKEITARMDEFKGTQLSNRQQLALADAARHLRFDVEDGQAFPVTPEQVNQARRTVDQSHDAWTTFNRIQENLVRGKLHGMATNARGQRVRRRTREVKGIDGNIKLNKALWTLAESLVDRMAVPAVGAAPFAPRIAA